MKQKHNQLSSIYIKLSFLLLIFFNTVNFASAQTVSGKVTHSLTVPTTGSIFYNARIEWAPLPQYQHLNFSYVKLGIQKPNGSWSYPNKGGSFYDFTPDVAGNWCFVVRGWHSGDGFGLYTSKECMNVTDSVSGEVTHRISSVAGEYKGKNLSVSVSPTSTFSGVNFSYAKLYIRKPKLASETSSPFLDPNISSTDTYNFTPDRAGEWCFKVRGWYGSGFSSYSSYTCINIKDPNMLIGGDFDNGISSPSPWVGHESLHTGNKIENANGTITFKTPVLSEQTNQAAAGYASYQAFYDACINGTVSSEWRCRKAEISYSPSDYGDPNPAGQAAPGDAGTTTWFAYQFKVENFFDQDDCDKSSYQGVVFSKCYVYLSQFHTGNINKNLSPNNAIKLQFERGSQNIQLSADTKMDCGLAEFENNYRCSNNIAADGTKRWDYASTSGTFPTIEENKNYLLKMKIKWEKGATGQVDIYLKGETDSDFVLVFQETNIQTIPTDSRLRLQTGMYWAGIPASKLYPSGNNGTPTSINMDDMWMTKKLCNLPQKYWSLSDNCY